MSGLDYVLVVWSLLAFGWWALALVLLYRSSHGAAPQVLAPSANLTVFKPLPPVSDERVRDRIRAALDSFAGQLDEHCTLLVGVPSDSVKPWRKVVAGWAGYSGPGQIRIVILNAPQQRANPKVAWLEQMAAEAGPGTWLWSDADVIAPPALLSSLRAELTLGSARAVTCAYCVRQISSAAQTVDALFVNLEFLPGALLLGRRRSLDLAFGAAVIFPATEFQRRMTWADLGCELADDHALGRGLAPVALSATVVETLPITGGLREALKHYYRWQKTVRWYRPFAYAALLLVLPLAGWTVRLFTGPTPFLAGTGVAVVWLAEVGIALAAFRIVACPTPGWTRLAIAVWPVLRLMAWLAVWLPFPVEWGGAEPVWRGRRKDALGRTR